jgi:putative tryptophan/tyrosine transport system substrate-binding protein
MRTGDRESGAAPTRRRSHRVNRRELMLLLGGAMTAAPALRAQQKSMPVIGFLSLASPRSIASYLASFNEGLTEAGYVDRQNVAVEYRWAEGRQDRLPELAADLVGRKVDVILSSGGPVPARAAKNATPTIPIVFITGDPIGEGLVTSLARPGGNLTGVSILTTELMPKRIELLCELVPQARTIALLVNPNTGAKRMEEMIQAVQEAAQVKGVQLHVLKAGIESEIDAAFATLAQLQADALAVSNDPYFNTRGDQIVALAARHPVPAIYGSRDPVAAGGLISYGSNTAVAYRRAATYVTRILAGSKAADLPVEQPTTFELVVNLKTANALGLSVSPSILARATEVIE